MCRIYTPVFVCGRSFQAAYCKCNAAIKLLIEVSKRRKEAPTTAGQLDNSAYRFEKISKKENQ